MGENNSLTPLKGCGVKTKSCTRKLDVQANVSKKKGTQKSYLTVPNEKEEVTSPLPVPLVAMQDVFFWCLAGPVCAGPISLVW